jgi:hypothetical protein
MEEEVAYVKSTTSIHETAESRIKFCVGAQVKSNMGSPLSMAISMGGIMGHGMGRGVHRKSMLVCIMKFVHFLMESGRDGSGTGVVGGL